ncbi:hypothetical protein [Sorangium cellulosum]|uniref:Cytochrome B n=1 Tax=Sorangium cellulosum TaxID=56 RepID=A0A150QIM5_SORCE|nr:hypothetical protein [Sorangium cellulosum]KYF67508.1 hypothetical protein BE15_20205 [Sorangium cellulosum]
MIYSIVLSLHSWLRWAVLLLGLAALVRSARGWAQRTPRTAADRKLGAAFVGSLDAQLLLGVLLYVVLSPVTPSSLAALKASMPVAALRFFAVEHAFGMIVAVAIAHVASARAKRAADPTTQHRRMALGVLFALLVVLAAIPWPFLPFGRPLFRLP